MNPPFFPGGQDEAMYFLTRSFDFVDSLSRFGCT